MPPIFNKQPKDAALRIMPKAAYMLILIIAAAVAGTLSYGAFLGNLPSRLIPVIEAADQIKIEVSLARLRADAALSGRSKASHSVWSHYERAENLVDFLLSDEKVMLPRMNSPELRDLLLRTRKQINRCRTITKSRFEAATRRAAAQDISGNIDDEFDRLLSLADGIHVQAGIAARNTVSDFRRVQASLILSTLLLAFLAGTVIYRFDLRRARDYHVIQSQNHQLQATEQQLRASNQQLMATEQQLRASNQQLTATEQQLRASNQQLTATEQQLRASNQQLTATEQQLRASNQQLMANEQSLRASEKRYRSLFANMSEGMALYSMVYDEAGKPVNYRIVDVNRQFVEIFSIPMEKAIGRLGTEAFGTDGPLYLAEYGRVAETGDVIRFERYYPALDRYFLICAYSPEPGSCAAVFSDVTGQKKADAAIRREARRLETLMYIANYKAADVRDLLEHALGKAISMLECATGFVYHYDEKTQMFTLNSGAQTTRACSKPQEGMTVSLAESGVLGEAVRRRKPIVLNNPASAAGSAVTVPGGDSPRRLLAVPVVRSGHVVAVACAADKETDFDDHDARELALLLDSVWKIADLRREQEERARLETRIQKLESVGVLAGGIAHDFNNLLTAVLANVTFAKIQALEGEPLAARLEEIETAALRAKELTQQLLTFAKGGKPVRKLVNLEHIIRDSAALAVTGSSVQCRFRFADDLCSAEVDAGQISQVINNLVINAVQAMPTGGTVRVEAENAYIDPDGRLPLDAGRYVRVSVIDKGIGIPPEHLGRVFDPYFTTKQKGSGLGLAVSHSVITAHAGHIAVDSRAGEGTAFSVYLPASCESIPEASGTKMLRITGSGSVLLMDDEEMLQRVCCDILKRFGYNVEAVRDGSEAVERYRQRLQERRPFDVVILDLTVPGGMGGREALEHILMIDPQAKALVSSGYSNDPVMSDYASYGFRGVIPKPYTMKSLFDAVNSLISSTGKEGQA